MLSVGRFEKTAWPLLAILTPFSALLFLWPELWRGGMFVGGDVLYYYIPQKSFLCESLRRGEFPLWNSLTGLGYPAVAESQTGILYPPTLLCCCWLSPTDAYLMLQLGHYLLCWMSTVMLGRRLGLSKSASLFSAVVFVFGWFPSRSCLEWAIVGGAYLPLTICSWESWLQTGKARHVWVTILATTGGLLSGHFHIPFITTLTLTLYAGVRLATEPRPRSVRSRLLTFFAAIGMSAAGYSVAAVQLIPTYELNLQGQRARATDTFAPTYGSIPPRHLLSSLWPWYAHQRDVDLDQWLNTVKVLSSDTSRVEAHFGCGSIATCAACGLLLFAFCRRKVTPLGWCGLVIAASSLLMATGIPLIWLQHLPGFGFFRGAGRYSIAASLVVALAGAVALELLLKKFPLRIQYAGWTVAIVASIVQLKAIAEVTSYSFAAPFNPVSRIEASEFAKTFRATTVPPRVFAPTPNLLNLMGASTMPAYLGIAPAAYSSPAIPFALNTGTRTWSQFDASTIDWFRRASIQYVLTIRPAEAPPGSMRLVGKGSDPFLSFVWGLEGSPFFVYEVVGFSKRAHLASGAGRVEVKSYTANKVVMIVEAEKADRLVLTDLDDKGWSVRINGLETDGVLVDSLFRGVDVPAGRSEVVWRYRPRSLEMGAAVSCLTLTILLLWQVRLVWLKRNRESAADNLMRT